MNIHYKGYNCGLYRAHYRDPNYIALWMEGDQGPIATCTVYIEEAKPAADEVVIKSWSENEGMAEFLINQGIIGPTIREIPAGFVKATIHKLLKSP